MKITDFYKLKYFKPAEILNNCDHLDLLDFEVIEKLDKLRLKLGVAVNILSLTNGKHENGSLHYSGKAVDFFTKAEPSLVLKHSLSVGFTGFGYYTNEKGVKSYHCDIRDEYAFWRAVKKDGKWVYKGLLT